MKDLTLPSATEWPLSGNNTFPSWPRSDAGQEWKPRHGGNSQPVSTNKRKREGDVASKDKKKRKNDKDKDHVVSSDNEYTTDEDDKDVCGYPLEKQKPPEDGRVGENGHSGYGFGEYTLEELRAVVPIENSGQVCCSFVLTSIDFLIQHYAGKFTWTRLSIFVYFVWSVSIHAVVLSPARGGFEETRRR